MAEMRGVGGGKASGALSTDDGANVPPPPASVAAVGEENVEGQFSAVINVHNCNLQQIEAAIAANAHEVDPHPAIAGKFVKRHPIYLVAFDTANVDEQGRPAEGKPLELDLQMIRQIFSARPDYARFISGDQPPEDGSHIRVQGMHTIAELDQQGRPTGRVRLGNPDEVPQPDKGQQ